MTLRIQTVFFINGVTTSFLSEVGITPDSNDPFIPNTSAGITVQPPSPHLLSARWELGPDDKTFEGALPISLRRPPLDYRINAQTYLCDWCK